MSDESELKLTKAILYCSVKHCSNCGYVNCENFQTQRKSEVCADYISYKERIQSLLRELDRKEKALSRVKTEKDRVIKTINKDRKRLIRRKQELEQSLKLWTGTKEARETIFWQQKRKISELEEVNAELKELLNCSNCSELSEDECEVCAEYSHFKCKGKEQLTKAKELLKRCYENHIYLEPLRSEIEQFLKEIEK